MSPKLVTLQDKPLSAQHSGGLIVWTDMAFQNAHDFNVHGSTFNDVAGDQNNYITNVLNSGQSTLSFLGRLVRS